MSNRAPFPDYETFELLIGDRSGNGYPVSVVQSLTGEASITCDLDPQSDELIEAVAALAEGTVDGEGLRQIGLFLFEHLFAGSIAPLFRSNLAVVRASQKHLQIKLRIEAPALAALPWEYLYDPVEDIFLATNVETTLVRFLPLRLPARPTKTKLPLRLLLVISSPNDLQTLDVAAEKQIIQAALADLIKMGQLELQVIERATLDIISQALRQFQPQLFHLVGHSLFDGTSATVILTDEANHSRFVGERDFRELLAISQALRVAVLNTCQSATLSASQLLVGLAPQLLQRQLSAVIAMQFPIRDQAALAFCRDFYRSLALGYPIDAAVSEGRRGILLALGSTASDWGVPVLFLRAKTAQLFEFEQAELSDKGLLTIPAPPAPTKPPSVQGFVGRGVELTRYGNDLQTEGMAIIAGMPGVGKTMLMAQLAERVAAPKQIFWHTFHQDESVLTLIWKLAAFLAWHGKDQLWQMLQATQRSGGQPSPPSILLDYLCQQLQGEAYVICLDDFHLLHQEHKDPLLEQLIAGISAIVQPAQLKLLIASREAPLFKELLMTQPLQGLTRSDAQNFLTKQGLTLAETLISELYTRTEGNAELLTLAAQALRNSKEPAQLIQQLAMSDNIEHYLLTQIDDNLTEDQRAVMNGVAILLGYPGTSQEIESTKAAKNVRRLLIYLTNRYLLSAALDKTDKRYSQHAIVQTFYYELLSHEERLALHQRVASYYEATEHDLLKAAMHYVRAGDPVKAATLAIVDVWAALGRGHAQILRRLFSEVQMATLNAELQARVEIAKGEIFHFFGDTAEAQTQYNAALAILNQSPDSPAVRKQRAYIYQTMGELLSSEAPQAALAWLERGLAEIEGLHEPEATQRRAALLIQIGGVYDLLSRFDEAEAATQQGLQLVATPLSQLMVDALMNLGSIYSARGQVEQAGHYTQQAVELCDQLHDPYRHFKLLAMTAMNKEALGDWQGALNDHHTALALIDALGNPNGRVVERINLGYLLLQLEQLDEAALHLRTALDLAQRSHLQEPFITIQVNLAHIAFRHNDFAATLAALQMAEQAATELGLVDSQAEIAYLRAQVQLAQGNLPAARQHAEFALEQAIQLEKDVEQGIALRVLGQVCAAEGKRDEAAATFERSLAMLAEKDHFEFTRTQQYKAQLLPAHLIS